MRSDARKRLHPEQVTTLTMTATQFAEEIRNAREAAWRQGFLACQESRHTAHRDDNPYRSAS